MCKRPSLGCTPLRARECQPSALAIDARSGLSDKQVAAELGAMSKLSRKLFDGAKIWPIRWWQDASDNITRYVKHPRIAEWWRAA
jgi:hypothetical protein